MLHYRSVNFRFQVTNNCLNTKNAVYDKQIKKLNRELKIKTELRAENIKEINRLQDKINVRRTCVNYTVNKRVFLKFILYFYYCLFFNRHQYQESELIRVQSELTRLVAAHETSVRKRQEIVEDMDKLSEKKKRTDSVVETLERNLVTLQGDNVKLKSAFELSEREKKLLEKNVAKLNGKY